MEPRSLFSIILKVLGVFFIKNILETFSRLLSVLVYLPQYETEQEGYFNLGVTIPPLVLYTLFSWLLIFRTDSIINLLRLDKNTGPVSTPVQLNKYTLLSTALVIIGGWMLAYEIPEFFRHVVYYLQERKLYVRMVRPDISYLAMSASKIAIAFAIIVFNKKLVKIIGKRIG
jgi:hypothetical protein